MKYEVSPTCISEHNGYILILLGKKEIDTLLNGQSISYKVKEPVKHLSVECRLDYKGPDIKNGYKIIWELIE